jgi:hypothetical protein
MEDSYSDEFTISDTLQDHFNPDTGRTDLSIEEVIKSFQPPPPRYSTQLKPVSRQHTEISDHIPEDHSFKEESIHTEHEISHSIQDTLSSINTSPHKASVPKLDLTQLSNPIPVISASGSPVKIKQIDTLNRSTQYEQIIYETPQALFQSEEVHADHGANLAKTKAKETVEEIDNVEYVNKEVARRIELLRKKRQEQKDRQLQEKRLARALEALEIIKKEEEELMQKLGLSARKPEENKSKVCKVKDFVFYTLCCKKFKSVHSCDSDSITSLGLYTLRYSPSISIYNVLLSSSLLKFI